VTPHLAPAGSLPDRCFAPMPTMHSFLHYT
jgi:hypothetical protein